MTATNVPILIPILRNDSPFLNEVEKYTWFGERVVQVIVEGPDVCIGVCPERPKTWLDTGLKIVSLIFTLGLSFLTAVISKVIYRSFHNPVIANLTIESPHSVPIEYVEHTFSLLTEQGAPYYQHIMINAEALENGQPLVLDSAIIDTYLESYLAVTKKMTEEEALFCQNMHMQVLMGMSLRYHDRVEEVLDEITKLYNKDPAPIDPGKTIA